MKIVDRYLIRGFLSPLIYCIVLFTVLFIIVDGFNNLNDFLKYNISLKIILTYYLYLFPLLLVQIAPIAALVSILYVLGNLNRHNEISALKASGVSAFQILSPYLFMGILLSASILLISETLVPYSSINSTSIREGLIQKGSENNERAIKNVTLYGKKNRIIYAREYDVLTQTLRDIVILEDRPDQILASKLTAEKAHYENGAWVFYKVIKYDVDDKGDILGEPLVAEKLDFDMPEKPEDFIRQALQVEFMSARQLKDYIHHLKGTSRKLTRRLWVDFHYKIAFPFISFIVMLIGAPLAMKTERGSAMVGIGTSLMIVILYYGIASVCLAVGKGGFISPFLAAWFGNIFFAFIGIILIRQST